MVVVIMKRGTAMNQGEYAVYQIQINGITTLPNQKHATDVLTRHAVPGNQQMITPASKTSPGSINVARLCTFWRGDSEETRWQHEVRKALSDIGASEITITAEPWQMLPGYPQGELFQEKEVSV